MKLVAYIQSEVRDKNGKLIHFEKKEANSLVRGFIDTYYPNSAQANLPNCIDTTGASYTQTAATTSQSLTGPAGDNTYGIVIGTGTTPVAITDRALVSKIAHGNSAGQVAYLITTFTTPATVGTTHSYTISRGFVNNSGNAISVTEVGMIVYGTGTNKNLIDRTLMSFSIANGATGTVTYTIQVSI